jgi:hypothetical protein
MNEDERDPNDNAVALSALAREVLLRIQAELARRERELVDTQLAGICAGGSNFKSPGARASKNSGR